MWYKQRSIGVDSSFSLEEKVEKFDIGKFHVQHKKFEHISISKNTLSRNSLQKSP